MNQNKKGDMTPFVMHRKPKRQNAFFLPLVWVASHIASGGKRLTVHRQGIAGLKPPYLVLSMHQGFTDYFITPRALFPHRASYVSDMEGFANYGKWLYSQIGCIPTRRFVANPTLIQSIRHVVQHNKDIIVVFPEARHSNVGTNSPLPASTGKLVKMLGIPVVIQKLHGSYLACPIWDETHTRKAPLVSTLECILQPADIQRMTADDITSLINRHFAYDEYRWQWENRIRIDYPKRTEGLHKMLYQCPACGAQQHMGSHADAIFCSRCQKRWRMDEYGRLCAEDGDTKFPHIPDWYAWQQEQVAAEISDGRYLFAEDVRIEALPNEKGFVPMGTGQLVHSSAGFRFNFAQSGEIKYFRSGSLFSVHTEYDYRGKGDCLVLSTKNCCYYLYACGNPLPVTKLQFAAEIFHTASKKAGTAV